MMISLDNVPIKYYYDFLDLGYIAYSASNFILIFGNKDEAVNIWKKTMKSWKTEKIKVWFIESAGTYDFIMYGESSKNNDTNWVFCKTLEISENYKRFKDRYLCRVTLWSVHS